MPICTIDLLLKKMRREHLPLAVDSRKVSPGGIFVAVNSSMDTPAYISDAATRGAAFIVTDNRNVTHIPPSVTSVSVSNPRLAAAQLAEACFDTMKLPFPLVGVTGTNGKTTTTFLLEHLFCSCGRRAGVIGTIATRWPGHNTPASMTTPDCPELHAMLAAMKESGVQAAAMEVSSHALDQDRAACIPFSGAVFTNLTQDHLDYHKTFEAYFAAKTRLFLDLPRNDKAMSIGTDAEWGSRLARLVIESFGTAPRLITFGLKSFQLPAATQARHLQGTVLSSTTKGLHMAMELSGSRETLRWELTSPLVGAFNAENLLAVQAIALGMGFSPEDFRCFTDFYGVPGRLERIRNDRGLDIFVDYAHTPDALTNVLGALRGAGFSRIVCVFGCGGNRDKTKRPLMGKAVARDADIAVLTSDNPRHEEPMDIIKDVLPGLKDAKDVVVEADRRTAIARALELLKPGDALLVAGKGHETTQQIGDIKYPFSDQETIRELC